VPASHASHYYLEDSRGVRLVDLHNGDHDAAYVLRPRHSGRLYLRRTSDDVEFVIPNEPEVVAVADLTPAEPRVRGRGAANDAFEMLFALPFGKRFVDSFHTDVPARAPGAEVDRALAPSATRGAPWRTYGAVGLLGLGAASATAGALTIASAHGLKTSLAAGASQAQVADVNDRVRGRNVAAGAEIAAAGAATIAGCVLLLWPSGPRVGVTATASSGGVLVDGRF
jgi:hypothetical protein